MYVLTGSDLAVKESTETCQLVTKSPLLPPPRAPGALDNQYPSSAVSQYYNRK